MRRALLVGINHYHWAPLTGCINDVNNMAQALEEHHDSTPNFHVKKLTSDRVHITKGQLFRCIKELFDKPAEIALMYFSGHGAHRELGGYLVTQDAEEHNVGLSLNEIVELANMSTKIKEIIIILDTCYSGITGNIDPLNQNIVSIRRGVTVLASSMQDENSWEKNGRGVFTSIISEAINGGAADVLGHVTLAGIYNYVDKALGPWDQRPVFKSYVTHLFSIKNHQPEIDPEWLENLADYFPKAESEYKLSPAYEPTAQPKAPEKEVIFSFLQKCVRKNLVEPVDEEHMYYAAMNHKSCRLTKLGQLYWKMARHGKI